MKQTKTLKKDSLTVRGSPNNKQRSREAKAEAEITKGTLCRDRCFTSQNAPHNSTQYLIDIHQNHSYSTEEDFGNMLDKV